MLLLIYYLMFAENVAINSCVRPERFDNVRLELWVKTWTLF